VAAFLAAHPEFELVPLGNPATGGDMLSLTPLQHGTDGFFAAVMERRPTA
jgi:16S rRNA (cytosine967-C5)-methyltransferase